MTGPELREALGGTPGLAAEPTECADDLSSAAGPSRQRQWPRGLGRVLARVDVWILIATVAGVIIAYLTLVKPH